MEGPTGRGLRGESAEILNTVRIHTNPTSRAQESPNPPSKPNKAMKTSRSLTRSQWYWASQNLMVTPTCGYCGGGRPITSNTS